MGWIIVPVVLIGFILFLVKILSFKYSPAPKSIETKPIRGLNKLSDHLEQSINKGYMENVEHRVRRESKLKENEYEWRLLDLKRYFILTSLLKEAPMFSEKVDELWHQMLMFTREYDDFSKKYLGRVLHHSPNVKGVSDPDLRGFFDWIYAELFEIRKENIHLYHGFFRHPVNPGIVEEFKHLSENELVERYFNSHSAYIETIRSLIASMKDTAHTLEDQEKSVIREKMHKYKARDDYNGMLVPFLVVSYFHYDDFLQYMKVSSESSSSCASCGYSSSCDSSSSGGSSCSSCGGGGD